MPSRMYGLPVFITPCLLPRGCCLCSMGSRSNTCAEHMLWEIAKHEVLVVGIVVVPGDAQWRNLQPCSEGLCRVDVVRQRAPGIEENDVYFRFA
jgi:hypothetical protein